MLKNSNIHGVLFDLDGTLVDTAPDLANALNILLKQEGRAELAYEKIRPVVSHGGIAIIKLGFNMQPSNPEFEPLRQRFLKIYEDNICQHSCLFKGLDKVLHQLENLNIPWGIVTNKPTWLSEPLLQQLNLDKRLSTLVCGDTLKERKPHPMPMFYAAEQLNIAPEKILYIGDAQRDIEAGRLAGMQTMAAGFGYIESHDPAENWEADYLINNSEDLYSFLFNE